MGMESVKMEYSNHELAEAYKRKARLVGADIIDFELVAGDRVLLKRIRYNGRGRVEIPSFITGCFYKDDDLSELKISDGCEYTELYINNNIDEWFDASGLCSGLNSKRLKVVFRYPERVMKMSYMFSGCESLEKLDISNLDTRNVTDMSGMFNYCEYLKEIELSNFDTSNVTDMSYMFYGCTFLEILDISKLNTRNVINMSSMFNDCISLKELDISRLDRRNVKDMSCMLADCGGIEELDISKLDMRNIDTWGMFSDCETKVIIDSSKWEGKKQIWEAFRSYSTGWELEEDVWDRVKDIRGLVGIKNK